MVTQEETEAYETWKLALEYIGQHYKFDGEPFLIGERYVHTSGEAAQVILLSLEGVLFRFDDGTCMFREHTSYKLRERWTKES
jgi:hypothetical protein